MSTIEKIQRYIEKTKFNRRTYDMTCKEFFEVAHAGDEYEIASLAFKYGRAKGYRAAKAEGKG